MSNSKIYLLGSLKRGKNRKERILLKLTSIKHTLDHNPDRKQKASSKTNMAVDFFQCLSKGLHIISRLYEFLFKHEFNFSLKICLYMNISSFFISKGSFVFFPSFPEIFRIILSFFLFLFIPAFHHTISL